MTTPTLGDLLSPAADRMTAATQRARRQRELGHLPPAIRETARVTDALQRYLAEVIADSGIHPYLSTDNAAIYLAIHAREALRAATHHLATAARVITPLATAPDPDPVTPDIAAIADRLTAGHDLLQTHFTSNAQGNRAPTSRWSAVVTSPAFTTALLKEISDQAEQAWQLTDGLSHAITGTSALYGTAPAELDHAARWLEQAQAHLDQVPGHDHGGFPGRYLLHVLPAHHVPPPQPLTAPETLAGLCQGITTSAERLHAPAFALPRDASWAPLLTSESWRWTATARAVTAELTEILLRSLAERIHDLAAVPLASRLLATAAEAAASTCERWRHVTAAWGQMTTDTKGLTGPGVPDTSDLLIRLGRLAFDNQHWTPAKERQAPVRDPASLAPGPGQLVAVFTALHHAADALAATAAADDQNVSTAATAHRIYLPTRLLSENENIPRPYGPARPNHTTVLLKTYASAAAASTELTVALDAAALILNAPSQAITAARIATRPGQDTTQAGQPSQLNPAWPQPAIAKFELRGPVEQQLRQLKIDDRILILRAKAIDTADRHLLAEARTEASQRKNAPASSAQPGEQKKASARHTPAAQNFPSGPGQPIADRSAAVKTSAPRGAPARSSRRTRR